MTVKVYFLRDEKVGPAGRTVQTNTPANAAIEALLAGPTSADQAAGLSSTIPAGTKLNSVSIKDGIATVDFSSSFAGGGGSSSMQGRVAEVVYTLTQFHNVTQGVSFELDGQPATTLGGEGLVLDHPQTRADWESFTPAILVESPLPGDTLTSPVHVTGTANTFEATFQIRLTDAAGNKVYDHYATATSGTGTRGTYDETISFTTSNHGTGALTVLELSAKDGSEINVVTFPVTL